MVHKRCKSWRWHKGVVWIEEVKGCTKDAGWREYEGLHERHRSERVHEVMTQVGQGVCKKCESGRV